MQLYEVTIPGRWRLVLLAGSHEEAEHDSREEVKRVLAARHKHVLKTAPPELQDIMYSLLEDADVRAL